MSLSRTEIYALWWRFRFKSSLHEGFRCWGLCLAHCGGGSCPLGQAGIWVGAPVGAGANLWPSCLWESMLGRIGIACGAKGRCPVVPSRGVGAPDSTVASQPIVFLYPLSLGEGRIFFFDEMRDSHWGRDEDPLFDMATARRNASRTRGDKMVSRL